MQGAFQGTAQAFVSSLTNEPLLILGALITVYLVLGVLYESYIHPITILSTLPSAGVGALLALLITGSQLTVVAIIGIVLLIGIVKKNAIMMIDFALQAERVERKKPHDAILQAALLRFRPIMMTTMAALLGAVPLALGSGVGSELRRPLGITIIGGLILSQLLTLYTTPVIYLFFDGIAAKLAARKAKRRGGRDVAPEPAPEAAPRHEFLGALHPQAGRDHASHGGNGSRWIRGLQAPAGFRRSPQVDFPTISVSASMAGASPEIMASAVATPARTRVRGASPT